MIKYQKSIEFTGDIDSAITLAKNIFATNGFQINQNGQSELTVSGAGMTSTKQDPIKGLTKGKLKVIGDKLEFTGELGGVQFMKKFLYFFPPALGFGLAVFFVFTKQDINAGLTPVLCVAPWIIISPVMVKFIQKKTEGAIATALGNISREK
jgi:hypothetical protein